jgi:hypothetical protein
MRRGIDSGRNEPSVGLTEVTGDEIKTLALCYLADQVGDRAGMRTPQRQEEEWRVPVVLMPGGQPLGELTFDVQGALLVAESSSPEALADAADLAEPSGAG